MNGKRKTCLLVFLCSLFIFAFVSCASIPINSDTSKTDNLTVDVNQTQTDLTKDGTELSGTIDQIKTITDDAKISGTIPKADTVKIIEYVDTSKNQVKKLNNTIEKQTKQIGELDKARIEDNTKSNKLISTLTDTVNKLEKKISSRIQAIIVLSAALLGLILLVVLYWAIKIKKSFLI